MWSFTEMKRRRPNLFFKLRPVIRWILKLRSSPEAIAGGLALGVFIAFTPTYGVQLFLVVFLATLLNLNRPASLIPVWITNPVTIAPVYTFNYWVGCFIWPGPPVSEVSKQFVDITVTLAKLDFWDIHHQIVNLMAIGREVFIPLIIGSLLVGAVLAAAMYWGSLPLLRLFFSRRAKKRELTKENGPKR